MSSIHTLHGFATGPSGMPVDDELGRGGVAGSESDQRTAVVQPTLVEGGIKCLEHVVVGVAFLFCGPCVVVCLSCQDPDKHAFPRHVDQIPCMPNVIIDEWEVEILPSLKWVCPCGHVYRNFDDRHFRHFRDLPREWPCPSCGQRLLYLWQRRVGLGSGDGLSDRIDWLSQLRLASGSTASTRSGGSDPPLSESSFADSFGSPSIVRSSPGSPLTSTVWQGRMSSHSLSEYSLGEGDSFYSSTDDRTLIGSTLVGSAQTPRSSSTALQVLQSSRTTWEEAFDVDHAGRTEQQLACNSVGTSGLESEGELDHSHAVAEPLALPCPLRPDLYLRLDATPTSTKVPCCETCLLTLRWNGESWWCPDCLARAVFHVGSAPPAASTLLENIDTSRHESQVREHVVASPPRESLSTNVARLRPQDDGRGLAGGKWDLIPCPPSLESESFPVQDFEHCRTGMGRILSPTRPGFRAGGGTCGPWWAGPDPRCLPA